MNRLLLFEKTKGKTMNILGMTSLREQFCNYLHWHLSSLRALIHGIHSPLMAIEDGACQLVESHLADVVDLEAEKTGNFFHDGIFANFDEPLLIEKKRA